MSMIRPLWANPVVIRDLRVRMRGAKSYWHQAAYLLLLGLLATAGYASAVTEDNYFGGGMSVVDVQGRLQGFYYFIFMTLAALICLIAPALTAASITTERQRLTLDLLVTTPLTSAELLVGKLISSVAFLALLLSLSLPASALCVVLGGATLGDVFRVYLLLAMDGLVLSAIGIYFSCAVRGSLAALTWTYLSVIGYNIVTAWAYGVSSALGYMAGSGSNPVAALAALNPFVAVYNGGGAFELAGMQIPTVVGTSVPAFLLIRLLVTAASYRMGNYGGNPIGSLRRQLLFITGLGISGVTLGAISSFGSAARLGPGATMRVTASSGYLGGFLIFAFLLATPFLPSLFAPAHDEDAPQGQSFSSYRIACAFRPDHAGALPFFHIWFFVLTACAIGTVWIAGGPIPIEEWGLVLLSLYYLSGLGFLFWALARRASTLVQGVTPARALTFGFYVILFSFPVMLVSLTEWNWENHPMAYAWLLYPLTVLGKPELWAALLWTGTLCYAFGTLVFPFWRKVVPRGPGSPLLSGKGGGEAWASPPLGRERRRG